MSVRRGVKNIDTSWLPPHVLADRGCNSARNLAGAINFHLLAQPACARLGSDFYPGIFNRPIHPPPGGTSIIGSARLPPKIGC